MVKYSTIFSIAQQQVQVLGNVTEEKESELEEFIDYAKIVMGTLGHKVFEPLVQDQAAAPSTDEADQKKEQNFFIKRSGTNATHGSRMRAWSFWPAA